MEFSSRPIWCTTGAMQASYPLAWCVSASWRAHTIRGGSATPKTSVAG
jgi:hypothetical protein